ncbi:MAG TPA: hypothetical protein VFQ05_01635 [Candidatus Eisenbacteria bacterium]|nr:hypothetical protein [Candidatus Eisenbacteria bacterium]
MRRTPVTRHGSLAARLLASACWIGSLLLGAIGLGCSPERPGGSSEPAAKLAGQWRGRLTVNAEGDTTDLIVDLDRVAGRWTGQFDLPSFEVTDYPVEVTLAGREVTLRLSAAEIEFTGELSEVLAGVANTRGHPDSIVLRRVGTAELSEEFLRLEALAEDSTRVEHLSTAGTELRRQFNEDRAHPRLLMLLSPT